MGHRRTVVSDSGAPILRARTLFQCVTFQTPALVENMCSCGEGDWKEKEERCGVRGASEEVISVVSVGGAGDVERKEVGGIFALVALRRSAVALRRYCAGRNFMSTRRIAVLVESRRGRKVGRLKNAGSLSSRFSVFFVKKIQFVDVRGVHKSVCVEFVMSVRETVLCK